MDRANAPAAIEAARGLGELIAETPGGTSAARTETRLRHRDGTWRWFEATFTNLFTDPGVEGWVANLRDISERKQSDVALRQAQEVFRHAFDDAGIGMTLVELAELMRRSGEIDAYHLTIDLEKCEVRDEQGFLANFQIDEFVRHCLLNGLDDIALTLQHEGEIAAYEAQHPVPQSALRLAR